MFITVVPYLSGALRKKEYVCFYVGVIINEVLSIL